MSVNDARGSQRPTDADVRHQAYIGNVPVRWTEDTVATWIYRQGYGAAEYVLLNSATGVLGASQWAIVLFYTEEQATTFIEAGARTPGLFWPNGSNAFIRDGSYGLIIVPARGRGIIPGGGHQKAGGYAGQKASRRQFCG